MLKRSILFNSGDVYDASQIKKTVEQIKNTAELSGYSFIEIKIPELIPDNEKIVSIDFKINEGPRVYVNNIDISGNTRTVDKVIRREFSLSEGDAYNKYAIEYSRDSIRALNFFSDVEVKELRTEHPDKLDLEIIVEEKYRGSIIRCWLFKCNCHFFKFRFKRNKFFR